MLHLQGISKQYGSKVLFTDAEANLGQRSRVALIGPNGAGKSTLIKIILGEEHADSGKISRASALAIGHLAQEVPKFSGRTVLDEVVRLGGRRDELLATKDQFEKKFATETPTEAELERYGRILEEWEDLDESRLEARAKEILTGMGFKLTDFGRALTEFSGGWLMRVALSRILLLEPDLLLLDEPTNHLDLESLLWLEEFLQNYRGAMLLVSHDSAFLNRMVTEVVEIDQKRLWTYRGNLDSYAEQKEERLKVLRAQYAGQQAKIAEIEAFVARFGAKATKARQAQSRLKQLDKMERIELDESRETVRFRFPPAPHSGREVVTVRGADFAYEPGKPVLRKMDWVIQRGSRVAIVGVNGAGKTTLLKLLSGSMAPTTGFLKHGHEVKLGYYAQHQAESLDMKKTILQELESTAPELPVSRIRGIAGAFLFSGDAVEKRCGVLSGGEKARVALAKLLLSPSNFLILDEPTNHLDVESRGVLLEGLQDYEGTMVLVSHDREFMGPLVDAVLEIRDGQVHQLVGDYESYLKMKTREIAQTVKPRQAKVATPETPATARTGPSNNQRKSWERERDKLEAEITKLERQQSELHAKLANQATYDDQEQLKKLLEDQRGIEHQMSEKLSRWETLCSLLG